MLHVVCLNELDLIYYTVTGCFPAAGTVRCCQFERIRGNVCPPSKAPRELSTGVSTFIFVYDGCQCCSRLFRHLCFSFILKGRRSIKYHQKFYSVSHKLQIYNQILSLRRIYLNLRYFITFFLSISTHTHTHTHSQPPLFRRSNKAQGLNPACVENTHTPECILSACVCLCLSVLH